MEKVAPVGVYTSGKGSSAAGLTASVIRDPGSVSICYLYTFIFLSFTVYSICIRVSRGNLVLRQSDLYNFAEFSKHFVCEGSNCPICSEQGHDNYLFEMKLIMATFIKKIKFTM